MRTSRTASFNLPALLIVLIMIALVASYAIPNFIAAQIRAKEEATKANMHTVQLACEDYAVQSEGCYSSDPEKIRPLLPNGLKNPWTGEPPTLVWDPSDSGGFEKGTIVLSPNPKRVHDGVIDVTAGYRIRGAGCDGKLMALELTDAEPDTSRDVGAGLR